MYFLLSLHRLLNDLRSNNLFAGKKKTNKQNIIMAPHKYRIFSHDSNIISFRRPLGDANDSELNSLPDKQNQPPEQNKMKRLINKHNWSFAAFKQRSVSSPTLPTNQLNSNTMVATNVPLQHQPHTPQVNYVSGTSK